MTLEQAINGWLPLVGGVSGLALLVYMIAMLYFNRKKERDVQALRRELAEVRGMLIVIIGQLNAKKR